MVTDTHTYTRESNAYVLLLLHQLIGVPSCNVMASGIVSVPNEAISFIPVEHITDNASIGNYYITLFVLYATEPNCFLCGFIFALNSCDEQY